MDIADSTINFVFANLVGATGIAAAIAYGVGGRVADDRLVDRWITEAEINRQEIAMREAVEDEPRGSAPPIT